MLVYTINKNKNPQVVKVNNGIPGPKGERGLSAYEEALLEGFTGTRSQWVESLGGIKGEKGDKGDAFTYTDFTIDQMESLRGPQGIQGPQGEKGEKGDTGNAFTYADFSPLELESLRGPQGPQGEAGLQGIQGVQGIQGEIGPQGIQGEIGPQGIQGEVGPQGPSGLQGIQGEQGIPGEVGAQGASGVDGLSAYELAVGNGFIGTEVEWLASLEASSGTTIDENILKIDDVNGFVGINKLVPTAPLDVYGGAKLTAPDFTPFAEFPQSSGHEPQQYLKWGQVDIYQAHLNSIFLKPDEGDHARVGLGLTPTGNGRGAYLTCEATDIHYGNPGFGLFNIGTNPSEWFSSVIGEGSVNTEVYAMLTTEQHSSPSKPITHMLIGEDEGSRLEAIHFGFSDFSVKPLKITQANIVQVDGYLKAGKQLPEAPTPLENEATTWVSDGTLAGSVAGDVMMKITENATTKTVKVVDYTTGKVAGISELETAVANQTQYNITISSSEPSGGVDGDIWFVYEA